MFNIGAPLLTRISTVLAMKALPDEAALHSYLRNAFKGIAFLITGSVILGAAISAGLYVIYDQLITMGYAKANVLGITLGSAFLLVVICYYLADRWLSQRFGEKLRSKSIIDEKLDYFRDMASESINGFIEGLIDAPKQNKKRGGKGNTVDIRSAKKRR